MEERDVIQLLRHYRHDLLNQLQIIDGYLSMGKGEKARIKLADYVGHLQKESKLMNLNAPLFALYVLQLDTLHPNFRSSYYIHSENMDLHQVDQLLVEYFQKIMAITENMIDVMELYELKLHIYDKNSGIVQLELIIDGRFPDLSTLVETMGKVNEMITVSEHGDGITCAVCIP
ncbi:Spo0B domain-containing protein [Lentibacillus cibarius]|uniref:SpoOB alpha-helical domain-containing protein n=1 Tax=Lentibacillus cibarius TaxID=2583219 RepID=A0A5S3QGQ1_9BACI|nr:Spo0B domain-containing protein [Lentibacillus cibarius]TMN21072.1 hypothetical protein FFL34_02335 [Lentibacillus cibarius]